MNKKPKEEKRVFKIDIGSIKPDEVDAYMERVIKKFKENPKVEIDNIVNYRFNILGEEEDIFLPQREKTIKRWKEQGLLDGLEAPVHENVAKLLEPKSKQQIK